MSTCANAHCLCRSDPEPDCPAVTITFPVTDLDALLDPFSNADAFFAHIDDDRDYIDAPSRSAAQWSGIRRGGFGGE